MISISQDVRKVQKSCFSANVNVDGKHLNEIKKKVLKPSIQKTGFGMRPMKNGIKRKKDWVEEVGEKKMAAVFHTVMIV